MAAGNSIGHSSIGGRPPHEPSSMAQDNLDALPDLDLDAESNVPPGDIGQDWDKANVESIVTNNDPQRKTFDINNLDADRDDDLL